MEVNLWFGSAGTPSFAGPILLDGIAPVRASVADLGVDGKPELLVTDAQSSSLFVYGFIDASMGGYDGKCCGRDARSYGRCLQRTV